jgi:hypothetical protein
MTTLVNGLLLMAADRWGAGAVIVPTIVGPRLHRARPSDRSALMAVDVNPGHAGLPLRAMERLNR